jgi:hypothetical protein
VPPDLVDVRLKRPPAPDQALERVPGGEVVERELEHGVDLGLVRDPLEARLDQPDERVDRVVGDERPDRGERADDVDALRRQPDLLVRLAQRGLDQALARVAAPAGEGDLPGVAAQVGAALGQDRVQAAGVMEQRDEDGRVRPSAADFQCERLLRGEEGRGQVSPRGD